jgi:D-alanine-D-alanine ligase
MNIIIFNGDGLKPAKFNTWRTKNVEIEITKALKETGNNVSFINFHNLKQFYQDLKKIKCDESIVLTLSEYLDDNRDIFVSNILEELRIPFVGSGSEAVCNALLKEKAKAFFIKDEILTPRFFIVSSDEDINRGFLGYPVVLKPRGSGCSEGVSIAHNQDQFEKIVKDLLAEFKQPVMVEEYIGGKNCREYTVGVLNNDGNRVTTFAEIIIPETNGIKLLDEKVKNNLETDKISEVNDSLIKEKLRSIALKTMHSIDGKDVGRVDIRYDGSNFYVLEINLFPGLGDDSYLRRTLNFNDIGFDKLINMIVYSAILRYKMKPTQKMEAISAYIQKEIRKLSEAIETRFED